MLPCRGKKKKPCGLGKLWVKYIFCRLFHLARKRRVVDIYIYNIQPNWSSSPRIKLPYPLPWKQKQEEASKVCAAACGSCTSDGVAPAWRRTIEYRSIYRCIYILEQSIAMLLSVSRELMIKACSGFGGISAFSPIASAAWEGSNRL